MHNKLAMKSAGSHQDMVIVQQEEIPIRTEGVKPIITNTAAIILRYYVIAVHIRFQRSLRRRRHILHVRGGMDRIRRTFVGTSIRAHPEVLLIFVINTRADVSEGIAIRRIAAAATVYTIVKAVIPVKPYPTTIPAIPVFHYPPEAVGRVILIVPLAPDKFPVR